MKNKQSGFREEVLNVKLAELLSRNGILSVPETILNEGKGRRLPDVIMGEYWGVRVVIEGKVNDSSKIELVLQKKCRERLEEGIGSIAIGVIYPNELRYADWTSFDQTMRNSTLKVRVFTESSIGHWMNSDLHGLSAIIRRAYESLVTDDVVNIAVGELRNAIEEATSYLSNSYGTEGRLKELLISPNWGDE